MIRLLKRFADWLDRRFPPKVVVTQRMFDEWANDNMSAKTVAILQTQNLNSACLRIESLEKSVGAIKDILAKGQAGLKPEAERLRDSFVRGEFTRGPSREVVEAAG